MINNADSTINYNEIRYFEDEIEQDEFDFIVRDSRTDWSDVDTYNYIVSNDFAITMIGITYQNIVLKILLSSILENHVQNLT